MQLPTIHVVDDDKECRQVVVELANSMNLPVASYESAEEFISKYNGQRPACVVTDKKMPGMNGVELIELLREMSITIPIVMVTGFADVPSTVRAIRGGAITLIEKPCGRAELRKGIEEAVRLEQENLRKDTQLDDAKRLVATLDEKELDVAKLLVEGLANKVIASRLDCGLRTIEKRRSSILKKLNVQSVAELVQIWVLAHPN
ncbi:Transcriptional regulatory protein FixJ [Novipirellula galeiformis]|uniref:Transcriptional regulatory protein FixJ n=1 Tax=Novipirellula galeiformis TaxID=2528004 RepID=A0A5C6CL64_9BACT|nr:response regulator [Novipirellula galeiformis]TWU24051.1 Transcriptional regulatory protein FixJ [Novipirellula galeiformis]